MLKPSTASKNHRQYPKKIRKLKLQTKTDQKTATTSTKNCAAKITSKSEEDKDKKSSVL